jgi:diguanylate cyclase (GGDEF)-like protein/PAS domain S-box-containing protein
MDQYRVLILGAGRGGANFLRILLEEKVAQVVGIADIDQDAEAISIAKRHNIPVYMDALAALHACGSCLVFNLTGDHQLSLSASRTLGEGHVFGGAVTKFIWQLISRLKDAHQELTDNHAYMQAIINHARDGIVQIDDQGTIQLFNTATEQMFGYKSGEVIGKNVKILMPEPFHSQHDGFLARRMDANDDHYPGLEREVAAQCKDGSIFPMYVSIARMRFQNTYSYIGILRDITEEKRAEESLRQSEERLEMALDAAREGIWDLDVTSGNLYFSPQWGQLLGYRQEDIPMHVEEWKSLIHPADKTRVMKAMNDHMRGRMPFYEAEYRIRAHTGAWVWVLGHGRITRRDEHGKPQHVTGTTQNIMERKQAEEEIRKLAHFDKITGLPNRTLFSDRLIHAIAQAKRHKNNLALLFLDLDGFKHINDSFGHDVGDQLLQEVAKRLRQNTREADTVARMGGDEFIVILGKINAAEDAAIVAQKIVHALSVPVCLEGHTCQIGCSIGVSIYPDDGEEQENLIKQADHAMYLAKNSGGNAYRFFAA